MSLLRKMKKDLLKMNAPTREKQVCRALQTIFHDMKVFTYHVVSIKLKHMTTKQINENVYVLLNIFKTMWLVECYK